DGTFNLPDPDDEHVVAAALVGGAGAIVTENRKDFPTDKVPAPIKVLSAAEFAADTVAVSPDVALRAVETMAARYSAPPLTTDEILRRLVQRYPMTEAIELIRAAT
ncbi:MAG: PIN domain-containing protein, partial [Mycobacteriaceae bacterium]|nr:PIN domain-containing protein [Mycobacteriaceae bacterium]